MNRWLASPFTGPALLLVMVSVTVVTLGWYSFQIADRGRADAARQQRALDEARARFQRSGDERDLLTRYAPEYRALAGSGFIGAEQRVNWIDSLRVANDATGLFGVQYQIGTQSPYNLPEQPLAALTQSPMKIDLRLVHEGDLMRFLRVLARQQAGVFTINECVLERITPAEAAPRPVPNLRADCELAWITAARPGGESR